MIIIGIDPSLTSTGVAVIDTRDRLAIETMTITSKGRHGDELPKRRDRISDIAERVLAVALGARGADLKGAYGGADLIAIEAPSLGQHRQVGQLDRVGLWWLIVHRLMTYDIPVLAVPPATRAKYASGRGNAGKDEVLLSVARRYPQAEVRGNDEADAVALAAIGARAAGDPIEDHLPAVNATALAKLVVPELRVRVVVNEPRGAPGGGPDLMDIGRFTCGNDGSV